MSMTDVAARVSELATSQWGLFTTAQAEATGVTRLQISRLADAGLIERLDRGIYAIPAAIDERTPLRVAWLSLDRSHLAEDRLADPISSGVLSHTSAASLFGVGDLLEDEPEVTLPGRKQSRRGIRLHHGDLSSDDVTMRAGLPVTTPARTVADLLRDGHELSHVAEIAGDMLRRDLASRNDMATALEPLARRNQQSDGAALLEHLLDLVGLSSTALAANLASSDLGKALVGLGRRNALRHFTDAFFEVNIPQGPLNKAHISVMEEVAKHIELSQLPADPNTLFEVSNIVVSSTVTAPHDATAIQTGPDQNSE